MFLPMRLSLGTFLTVVIISIYLIFGEVGEDSDVPSSISAKDCLNAVGEPSGITR